MTARACPLCAGGVELAWAAVRDLEYGVPGEWDVLRCRGCGVLFLDPPTPREALPGLYPPGYAQHAGPGGLYGALRRHLHRRRARELARRYPRARRVLEVGAAAGQLLEALRAERPDLLLRGVDVTNPAGLPEVSLRTVREVVDDGERFDLVIADNVIEHDPDPAGLLAACRDALVPGGHLTGEVPSWRCLDARLFGPAWGGLHAPRHLFVFDEPSLRRLLAGAGLDGVAVRHSANPGNLAVSWLNLARTLTGAPARPGRPRGYALLLLACLPASGLQALLRRSSGLAFDAIRP